MKCEDCKHWFDNGTNLSSCDRDALLRERDFFCAAWERKKPFERPYTNADRIRAMTDEELADSFTSRCCPVKDEYYNCGEINKKEFSWEDCISCWLDWLKAPAEEEEE